VQNTSQSFVREMERAADVQEAPPMPPVPPVEEKVEGAHEAPPD